MYEGCVKMVVAVKIWHSHGARDWDWDIVLDAGTACPLGRHVRSFCLNTAQEDRCEFMKGYDPEWDESRKDVMSVVYCSHRDILEPANWMVKVYDVHARVIDCWFIEGRTEKEAFEEAEADVRLVGHRVNDWTMIRIEEPVRDFRVEQTRLELHLYHAHVQAPNAEIAEKMVREWSLIDITDMDPGEEYETYQDTIEIVNTDAELVAAEQSVEQVGELSFSEGMENFEEIWGDG